MTNTTDDGSGSLAKESKWGIGLTVVLSAAVFALADYVGALDVSPLPDWVENTVAVALAAGAGLAKAWATKNKK